MTDDQFAALLTAQNEKLERIATALEQLVGASEERATPAGEAPHPAVRAISPATARRQK